MTMLASWAAIDTHGPTSAYIVSDSRISWESSCCFDYGKKVFASHLYPEIFGYAGDVLFPSIVLSQILDMIDSDLLFNKRMSCQEKSKTVFEKIIYIFSKYPNVYGNNPIQILYISRDTIFEGYPTFHQYLVTWDRRNGWLHREIPFPERSDLLHVLGSGKKAFEENYIRYQSGDNAFTSRNVFHCFIDTLDNMGDDLFCGGPPQLVGIYRKPSSGAKKYGIISKNKRFFLGTEVPQNASFGNIEWRNENFELCSGDTKKILPEAAHQNDPLRRK